MFDFFRRSGRRTDWLDIDARVDSGIYQAWQSVRDTAGRFAGFMGRFTVSGPSRVAAELGSEAATLGLGGMVVMLALAQPAMRETQDGLRATGQFSITLLDRNGTEIGKRGILHDDAVPLEDIPDHVIRAVLATEDRRFFEHFGIDVPGTARALVENVRASSVVQGGSSITQQLAKNLFLSSERTIDRKIKEAFLALWLEARLSKREILKLYLDRAYLGGGAFGVEAAAQFYFGKSIRDVSLAEAAMLAGMLKAPTKFAPHRNLPAARGRANQVLTNMVDAGFMTEGQVHGARLNPAVAVETRSFDSPDYFLDWAFEEASRIAKDKGDFVLTVKTTVDLDLQKKADEAVLSTLREAGRSARVDQAAMVVMETDGAVRAMVGGTDYGDSQFNRATAAKRQPGSSFKTYVYMAAFEAGYRPNSSVVDSPVSCGRWSPQNYNRGFRGRMDVTTAFARSINTIPVKIANDIGRASILDVLQRVGIEGQKSICPMPLGVGEVTVLDHTNGYAVLASGGKGVRRYGVLEIRNSRGEVIYDHARDTPKPAQVYSPELAALMNQIMHAVVEWGTGGRAKLEFTHAAGKTGTSQSYRDAWFMGFTGQYVAGVWYGNDSFRPMNDITGGSLPAMTWQRFMAAAHTSPNIPQIPGLDLHPKQVADMAALAAAAKADPTLGKGRAQPASAVPAATLKVLGRLSDRLKAASAKPGEPAAPKDGNAKSRQGASAPRSVVDPADTASIGGNRDGEPARGPRP